MKNHFLTKIEFRKSRLECATLKKLEKRNEWYEKKSENTFSHGNIDSFNALGIYIKIERACLLFEGSL